MRHFPLTYATVFGFFIWGETCSKRKKWAFLKISEIFKILKIRNSSFVTLLILRHFIYLPKSIDRSLKTAPVAAIPVNPFCWSKSAKHDVTLTSLTADLL